MNMNLKDLIPVHLQAHLKQKSKTTPVEVLALSSSFALIQTDLVISSEEKVDCIISGDFPLKLEGHVLESVELPSPSSHQGRFILFSFDARTNQQVETLRGLLDYYSRLRRAGVQLSEVPTLKAKSA